METSSIPAPTTTTASPAAALFRRYDRGMGLSLDGIDDEVDFGSSLLYEFTEPGDPPLMQLRDMTIEAWVSIAPVGHGHLSSNPFDRVHKIFGKTANEYMLMYESAPPGAPELHRAGFAFFDIRPAIEYPCFGPGCDFDADPIELDPFIHIVGTKSSALGPANEASALFYNGILARKSGGFAPLFQGPDVHLTVGGPLVVDTGGGVLQTNWLQAVIEEVWSGTGATVQGTGANLYLYDPLGFSTAKLYRVAIRL
jgi:hypothetical protein